MKSIIDVNVCIDIEGPKTTFKRLKHNEFKENENASESKLHMRGRGTSTKE